MKLAWATDVHLNFLEPEQVVAWCRDVVLAESPDALLLSGDIAEAHDLEDQLALLERELSRPIYFVLGNHDFYRGSIADVRRRVRARCGESASLCWLGGVGVISLSDSTALVGHDGWGDARMGNHAESPIQLNDFRLIHELAFLEKEALGVALRALGDEAAAHVRRVLPQALASHEQVLFLTHVPPFREACTYQGKVADDDWAPYFACQAVGDALLEVMQAYPERQLTVLCGHTHDAARVEVRPNLTVKVGGAEYRDPRISELLIVA